MTSAELYSKIAVLHAPPAWACFPEVANSTGYAKRKRTADAVAMSLWPSRGLVVRGFEIKISASDLSRELKTPKKAEEIAKYCDEWWLVTPAGLVEDLTVQLPPKWGLMAPNKNGVLRTVRKASQLSPAPLTTHFVAAILRRAHEYQASVVKGYIRRDQIEDQLKLAREQGAAMVPSRVRIIEKDLKQAKDALAEFRSATGIDMYDGGWPRGKRYGEALKLGLSLMGRYGNDIGSVIHLCNAQATRLTEIAQRLGDLNGES